MILGFDCVMVLVRVYQIKKSGKIHKLRTIQSYKRTRLLLDTEEDSKEKVTVFSHGLNTEVAGSHEPLFISSHVYKLYTRMVFRHPVQATMDCFFGGRYLSLVARDSRSRKLVEIF